MFKRNRSTIKSKVKDISPSEAQDLIQNNKDNPSFLLLDVRTPEEFQQSHLNGAKLIDFYANNFTKEIMELDKSKKYLIYCRTGVRSSKTMKLMEKAGFKEVYNLSGGITRWNKSGLPH